MAAAAIPRHPGLLRRPHPSHRARQFPPHPLRRALWWVTPPHTPPPQTQSDCPRVEPRTWRLSPLGTRAPARAAAPLPPRRTPRRSRQRRRRRRPAARSRWRRRWTTSRSRWVLCALFALLRISLLCRQGPGQPCVLPEIHCENAMLGAGVKRSRAQSTRRWHMWLPRR